MRSGGGENVMDTMIALERNRTQTYEDTFGYLKSMTRDGKAEYLAIMLVSLVAGRGAMPCFLGLPREDFDGLLRHHFPGIDPRQFHHYGKPLPPDRSDEMADLRALFIAHIAPGEPHGGWHATILLAGCMAENHLWQDMGFRSRADVKGYLNLVFPALAAKNVKDMKWKKFFYKQLCNQEGIYTCRAPSCAVCCDYAKCFGPEN